MIKVSINIIGERHTQDTKYLNLYEKKSYRKRIENLIFRPKKKDLLEHDEGNVLWLVLKMRE